MNYANIKNCDIANGPGVRVSLFVSGCTHRCKGCFNEVAWDFSYGEPFTQETEQKLLAMLAPAHIKGITLLGGEPFEKVNQEPLIALLEKMRSLYPKKNVWAFSGYTYETLLARDEATRKFLSLVDVLVDGPFVEEKKDLMLRFRGSSNQRIIDVPASLKSGNIILWQDWQGNGRGMK